MHPQRTVDEALRLVRLGLNDCEIGRRLGIPRGTIRDWRHGRNLKRGLGREEPDCICSGEVQDPSAYAYLFGLYLGDGCILRCPKDVYKLTVALDQRYLGIIGECGAAMAAIRPHSDMWVGYTQRVGCILVNAHWKHWPCVFPQHGSGRKHERNIRLTNWQQDIVDAHPHRLIRGLIHSDGCRSINRVRVRLKWYAYPRYQFSNRSDDIRQIFCNACDALDVGWRRMNQWTIAVSRQTDVERLDLVVGPKS